MTEIIDIAEQYDTISKDFDRSRIRIWNSVKDFLQPTKNNFKLLPNYIFLNLDHHQMKKFYQLYIRIYPYFYLMSIL